MDDALAPCEERARKGDREMKRIEEI